MHATATARTTADRPPDPGNDCARVGGSGADRAGQTTDDCDYTAISAAPLAITIWPDRFAKAKGEKTVTWSELCRRIPREPDRPEKAACRLIKLATFGDARTDKGSLRHDANVIAVTGIEGDHDAGGMAPEAAIEVLERHQVRAMVYTSWSHTPEAPRWRVLAPLSQPVPPAERLALAEALNGLLGGCLAPESGALSQSYYIASAGPPAPSARWSSPSAIRTRVTASMIWTCGSNTAGRSA